MSTQFTPVDPSTLSHKQIQAAIGALVGAAVGDALGAPFEFKKAGLYTETFPTPVMGGSGEMIGGGAFNWAPGEFTDDTQMALALAESIVVNNGDFDAETTWNHFKAWSRQASDIGNTTRAALSQSDFRTAGKTAGELTNNHGGTGSLMRIAPIGIAGVRWGGTETFKIAKLQSDLTHTHTVDVCSAKIAAETIRNLILGADLEEALNSQKSNISPMYKGAFQEFVWSFWNPVDNPELSNSQSIFCLAQAVWAIRTTTSFEDAIVKAINMGDDADTVAAVTGAIAGALYGVQQIPSRWVTYVHGHVRQPDGTMKTYHQHDLIAMAYKLLGLSPRRMTKPEPIIPHTELHELGVYASNLAGAVAAPVGMGVVSLCRMEDMLHHQPDRREFFIIDEWEQGHNPHLWSVTHDAVNSIDAFLREGKEVIVHCHGGRSRTGFILKAWYMKRFNVEHYEAELWLEERWPHYTTWNTDFYNFLNNEWSI